MANSVHFVLGIVKLTFLLKTSSVPVFFAGMICEETLLSHHFSITVAGVVPVLVVRLGDVVQEGSRGAVAVGVGIVIAGELADVAAKA